MKNILEVKNLHKKFGNNIILNDVNFSIKEGETVALIGKNGSGKTTLINSILNLIEFDEGEIYLDLGESSFEANLNKVGYQFQEQLFSQGQTLKKLIKEYEIIYNQKFDVDFIKKILETFEIEDLSNKKTNHLSGGQKQRVNLFLAMLMKPSFLILDEFITGLDILTVDKILDYIREYKKENNLSMLIVTHQPEEISRLADRVIILKDGIIENNLEISEIENKYKSMHDFLREAI